ncbi:MAG: hypothetical protein NWF00_12105 [Candidatus Bathyarchaeota archaeon]|nr:hypothetical protein [Candidatus Bathyarchaeota archaeon]
MDKHKLVCMLVLFSVFLVLNAGCIGGVTQANPNWQYEGADWVYVTTIKGAYSQTVEIDLPNIAHWHIVGNCTGGEGKARFGLFRGGGGVMHEYGSSGLKEVGLNEFSSQRGPASIKLKITAENIKQYTLVVEYDAAAPLTYEIANQSAPSLTASATLSPTPTPTLTQKPTLTPEPTSNSTMLSTTSITPSVSPNQLPTHSTPQHTHTAQLTPTVSERPWNLPIEYLLGAATVTIGVAIFAVFLLSRKRSPTVIVESS